MSPILITRGGASALCALVMLACGSVSSSDDGAADDAGDDAGDDAADDGDDDQSGGLAATENSITATEGGERSDPEGVAPPASSVTNLSWRDARGAERTMVLGAYLYQYDFSFVGGAADPAEETVRSANDDAYGHEGFGYVVSHNDQNGNSPLGKANAPTAVESIIFSGGHHAIHRVEMIYDRDAEAGGNGIAIPVVIEWLVATGRDHPVWAVTWRTGEADNPDGVDLDTYRMDVRGPYGSLNFDGAADRGAGDAIGGVAWGDAEFAFRTGGDQLTMNSPWTYNSPNAVNFTQAWTATTNAEMGIVQTRTGDTEMGYPDRVVGRERGFTSADDYLDKGVCGPFGDERVYAMPCVPGWPYQMMNFDWAPEGTKPLDEATGTKLIAWGSPYGWLGASTFSTFTGGEADGRGDRSYADFIVLGPRCRYAGAACDQPGEVAGAIAAVEGLSAATIDGLTAGELVTEVPRGPGATDTKALASGYNDTYAVYTVRADGGQVAFTFTPAAGRPVDRPIFVVQGYTARAAPSVLVDGAAREVNTGAADSGAFVSLDTDTDQLWVTLNETVDAAVDIEIAAP